ncbi:protein ycf2 [Phtheirospermum japonicum]|uniref:Protein ycf2 n=1 Tax=Phtheirospermum japonicum TaxID=374723 RepID=A0A830CYN0_9LAMI|nr:protein ycf2 [Phtheirospermum japonicum]
MYEQFLNILFIRKKYFLCVSLKKKVLGRDTISPIESHVSNDFPHQITYKVKKTKQTNSSPSTKKIKTEPKKKS